MSDTINMNASGDRKRGRETPSMDRGSESKKHEISCVRCGSVFSLRSAEESWLRRKHFQLPKRCKQCRRGGSTAALRRVTAAKCELALALKLGEGQRLEVTVVDQRVNH